MEATYVPTAPPYAKSKRLDSLDSIRGLAALAVLLGHTVGAFSWPADWTRLPILNILFDGRSAVTMFFVLSGFVLSRPYLGSSTAGQPPRQLCLRTFYLRRLTRIYLPWLFVFALSALAQIYVPRTDATVPSTSAWLQGFWHFHLSAANALRQCAFLQHDHSQLLIPQDWSLGVELKGSALIPLFLFLMRKHVFLLLGVGLLLLFCVPTGHYYVSFIFGVMAARYYGTLEARLASFTTRAKLGTLCVGLLLYQVRLPASSFGPISNGIEKVVWCIAGLGCVLILITSLGSNRIERALSHGIFVGLGRISYSVYLLQFLILLCVLPPLIRALNAIGINQIPVLLPTTVCASLLSTIALALLTYRLIEVPSIALGRILTTRIQKHRRLAAYPSES